MSASTQARFASALLEPGLAVPPGLRVAAGINPVQRFAVHRNNTVVTLVDALAEGFPVTRALVGEDFFRTMARERVRIDPPRSPLIHEYGAGFADFIAAYAPAACVAYLADVARLEYLRVQAHHAADAQPLDVAAYHALLATPERIAGTRLALHPSCAWLDSPHALHSIWFAHQQPDALGEANLAAIDLDAAEAVLVIRPDAEVLVHPLPQRAVAWLHALRQGRALGAVVHAGADTADASDLERLLTLLIQQRLVVALDPSPETLQ